MSLDPDELRAEFVRLMTVDSEVKDARRREYNQAIFLPLDDPSFPGHAAWTGLDAQMVLEKFDRAVKNLKKGRKA